MNMQEMEELVEKRIMAEEIIQKIRTICRKLHNKKKCSIIRRFSLYLFKGFTLDEVGQFENVTGEYVRLNINTVLRILRHPKYKIDITYDQLNALREYIVMKKILNEGVKK